MSGSIAISGAVSTPTTVSYASLQTSYPLTTVTITVNGTPESFTGVSLYALLTNTAGGGGFVYPNVKNGQLEDYIQVSGSSGGRVVVSEGEIDPSFGGASASLTDIIAFEQGTTQITPQLIVPGDVNGGIGGRDVGGITRLTVGTATLAPATTSAASTAVTVSGLVTTPATDSVAQIQGLGSTKQTDTYLSGSTSTTVNFTGAPLFTVLSNAGLSSSNLLDQYVVATGTDGYGVVYSMAEIDPTYRSGATALLAYDDGSGTYPSIGGGNGAFRTTAPSDSKGGRYDSKVYSITVAAPCFLAGTAIRTARGETPVEALQVGDLVVTRITGRDVLRPVRWMGERRIDAARHPQPATVYPVRIRAHAFGDGLPRRDLMLSPDHAVFVDDVLVPIQCLVNGDSIVRHPARSIHYLHVELDSHDILLAEGLPVESFLDTGNRGHFGGGAVSTLHPRFSAQVWAADGCAPLVLTGSIIDRIKARLAERQTWPLVGIRN